MSKLITKDNLKIYYKIRNKSKLSEKTPIVFVHGWVVNWSCFKDEIKYFVRKKYPIIYLDLRGHGRSSKPNNIDSYHLDLMVEDINQILKKEGIKKIILIGHSMGGMISALFSVKYPNKLKKLILINSYYRNPLYSKKILFFNSHRRFARLIYEYVLTYTSIQQEFKRVKIDFSKMKSKSDFYIALMEIKNPLRLSFLTLGAMFKYNVTKELKKIKVPTLIIASKDDQFFSVKDEKNFSKIIQKSKLIIDEGTHSIIMKKPILISHQIRDFIEK